MEGRTGTACTAKAPSTDITHDVLAGAARGEQPALRQVFATVHRTVLAYCRARLGRGSRVLDSPEDLAQTVCLNLLRALPHYQDTQRPFMAYVYVSAANAVTDAHRRAARRRTEQLTDAHEPIDTGPGPEERGVHADVAQQARALLDTLPERMREVLVLRVALGLSVRQAAEMLEINEQTLRVTQHRALRRLRAAPA
ncbi:MAG: sigma-70 family RNA polymerase sigma factor [Pseudonocardia sp.]